MLSASAAQQPNIIVILADDAGYADFRFQGGGINGDFAALTPNLDSLATNGVKFTSGYVSGPVCCPSRAGLMTGRYVHHFTKGSQAGKKAMDRMSGSGVFVFAAQPQRDRPVAQLPLALP